MYIYNCCCNVWWWSVARQAYGNIVDDLVQRFIGLGLTPKEDTYQALLLAYSRQVCRFYTLVY